VLCSQDLPVPKPPEKWTINDDNNDDGPVPMEQDISDPDFQPSASNEQHLIFQGELNDLVRDLNLSKSQAEFLGSRLQGWNLLQKNKNISIFRYRPKYIAQYFASAGDLVYCTDIVNVVAALGQDHKTDEWRLFVDSSKRSLKAVLHNGNKHPSIPIAYAVHTKETYENIKNLLDKINYNKHCWNVCGDLKIIVILLGIQLGYIKYCCFICEWDIRAKDKHYSVKHWKKVRNCPQEKEMLFTIP
jgi:hypothetical protein